MTKKSFIIIVITSFFATHIADLIESVVSNTLIGGRSGFPFKDSLSMGFEGGSSDNFMFVLNMLFWFIVIFIIWQFLQKSIDKKS